VKRSARRPRRAAALALAALAAAAAGVLLWNRGRAPAVPPSLLLVTLDTFRADRLGRGLTPNLEALAARGVWFEEAVASVPLTLPSHATILSGLEPTRHGVRDNGTYVFPAEPPTLATVLRQRGYATAAFVGAHVLDRRFGLARGFGHYDDRIERVSEGPSVLESERRGDVVAEAATAWIRAQTVPYFAWVHLYDPHAPYAPPEPHARAHGAPYDGEVAFTDACVGRVLEAARAVSGDALLVAVVADHGEGLGDHGERTHGLFVYQSTLRVPLILAGPGLPSGERRRGLARTADVAPTVLGAMGVPAPSDLDGADLMRTKPQEAYAESRYAAGFGWAPLFSFRAGALKFVEAPRPELYDLAADPHETRDLARERPSDAARLRSALAAFRRAERAGSAAPIDPGSAEKLRALGYVAGPAPALSVATGRDPKDALPLWQRFEEASWARTRGEPEAAASALRDLVAQDPGNPAFLRALASALRLGGRADAAVRVLDDLTRAAPDDALAWHERALAQAAAGRLAEAVASAERAAALDPALPEPHNHLGVLRARQGRAREALEAFDAAVRLDPNNARAWNNRANALRALGRRDEAAVAYREAAQRAPAYADPRNGLGVLAVEAGDLEGAAAAFTGVLEREPDHADARVNLAFVRARQGRVDEARTLLGAVLASPASPPDVRERARALLRALGR
jgi:arylsulfatase A-like enzyme/Flp pilus assembly protein TadD